MLFWVFATYRAIRPRRRLEGSDASRMSDVSWPESGAATSASASYPLALAPQEGRELAGTLRANER
eukprot:6192981-Pleurochrysis_carterae.AAC.1